MRVAGETNKRCLFWLVALTTVLVLATSVQAAIVEEIIQIPAEVKNMYGLATKQNFTVTILRDDSRTVPQPFLILNHGRAVNAEGRVKVGRATYRKQSEYFIEKGFVVFSITRVGYGVTGGPDVEDTGRCGNKQYAPGYAAGGVQTFRTIEVAKTRPFVDQNRGLVIGQSFGGTLSVEAAAQNIPGVIAAMNFAGGGGGNPDTQPGEPCRPDRLEALFASYGKTAKAPTLWLYSKNDKYMGQKYPHDWFDAFISSGGRGEFVQLPSHGADGHASFTRNMSAWMPHVERFLASVGF